jgi:glycosyltransferase involved in cell wall biosynthesis
MGLGSAYIDGLSRCTGNFVILMDADLSHHVRITSRDNYTNNIYSLSSFLSLSRDKRRLMLILLLEPDISQVAVFSVGT